MVAVVGPAAACCVAAFKVGLPHHFSDGPAKFFARASKMSKSTYPLKLPNSVKDAAAELAKIDGVSLNQFIAAAVAEKVGTLRTASEFLRQRSGTAKPKDLVKFLRRAPKLPTIEGDERV